MKFSVITINFNEASGLQRTIDSVLRQTNHDYEFIIIDGGSTDASVDTIHKYEEGISYWVSEPDNGIYHAMNKGVKAAHGEYCIFMNSGDTFFSPDVLENVAQTELVADVVCGDICFGRDNICSNPKKVTMKTFYKHTLFHQACFIKTELLKKTPYDETMRSAADWKWFLHTLVFNHGSYCYYPITIALFEGGGFSEKQHEVGQKEVENELKQCLPPRILEDYEDYCVGTTPFRRLMNYVELVPKLKTLIYSIDVAVLKILNFKLHLDWIKKL